VRSTALVKQLVLFFAPWQGWKQSYIFYNCVRRSINLRVNFVNVDFLSIGIEWSSQYFDLSHLP